MALLSVDGRSAHPPGMARMGACPTVPIVPVGGRRGLAGGAAVLDAGAVAIALERLSAVRSLDPSLWA